MKKSLENIFKESLENLELPYQNGAWEAFSAKHLPVTKPFYKTKWFGAASVGVVGVGIASYFLLANNSAILTENAKQNAKNADIPSKELTTKDNSKAVNTYVSPIIVSNPEEKAVVNSLNVNGTGVSIITIENENTPLNKIDLTDIISTQLTSPNTSQKSTTSSMSSLEENKSLNLPAQICLGQEFILKNDYKTRSLFVQSTGNKTFEILAGGNISFTDTKEGTIEIKDGNANYSVKVVQAESTISLDENRADYATTGIPTISIKGSGANEITWTSNLKSIETNGNELIVHPYNTKEVKITATGKDAYGCKMEESKTIYLEEKCMLFAPNAILPLDNDARNQYFMPYSLQKRNTPFKMLIIDPKTGATIFSTTDASNPWNGYDARTNQLVSQGSIWIWRVILEKPNLGEQSEYQSTVIRN